MPTTHSDRLQVDRWIHGTLPRAYGVVEQWFGPHWAPVQEGDFYYLHEMSGTVDTENEAEGWVTRQVIEGVDLLGLLDTHQVTLVLSSFLCVPVEGGQWSIQVQYAVGRKPR